MSINTEYWDRISSDDWDGYYEKFDAIRINTTTGTAAFDPPTIEVYDSLNDYWVCIFSGGNNGLGWGYPPNNRIALMSSAFDDPSAADLIAFLETNVQGVQ